MGHVVKDLATVKRGECYPLPAFMGAVGLGRHGLRAARRDGLRVEYRHGRGYVLGDWWLDYLSKPTTSTGTNAE